MIKPFAPHRLLPLPLRTWLRGFDPGFQFAKSEILIRDRRVKELETEVAALRQQSTDLREEIAASRKDINGFVDTRIAFEPVASDAAPVPDDRADLLVTFCNIFPYGLALGRLPWSGEAFGWIDLSNFAPGALGADGICHTRQGFWILLQVAVGGVSGLLRLDDQLRPMRLYELKQTIDAHSLIEYEDGFLVTDTRQNRVNLLRVDSADQLHEEEFWRACNSDVDTLHVNSIACLDGDVYVSHFGPQPEKGWWESQCGCIVNVTRGETVCDGLAHPHTLVVHQGSLYWLESRRGRVHRYTPGNGHAVLYHLGVYLRGMAFDDRYLYLGASALRRRSRSTGVMCVHATAQEDQWHSWLYCINRETGSLARRRLTLFGAEVYDLAILSKSSSSSAPADGASIARLWKFEDEIALRNAAITSGDSNIAGLTARVAELEAEIASLKQR